MASKTVQMTAPNGAKVTVSEDRVDNLVRNGFTETSTPKAPAKKSASKKSSKK